MNQQSVRTDSCSILKQAYQDIVRLAAEVGIDGCEVLANLPAPGQLWHGASVPVVSASYRGSCSVLFHINSTASGQEWPLLRFHTFKQGGDARTFHGLQWLLKNSNSRLSKPVNACQISIRTDVTDTLHRLQAEKRLKRFRLVHCDFMQSAPLTIDSAWLTHRLCGEATTTLCQRVGLRQGDGRLLAPLETVSGVLTGFQSIVPTVMGDQKRFLVAHSGLLTGSFFRIRPSDPDAESAVMICEGVATALSLALVWQGEIRAALTASNLGAVRSGIEGRAIFAHDMDIYKPAVGNVGLAAACQALRAGDLLLTPKFNLYDLELQPTDFNDVLNLYGIDELYRQSRCNYHHC